MLAKKEKEQYHVITSMGFYTVQKMDSSENQICVASSRPSIFAHEVCFVSLVGYNEVSIITTSSSHSTLQVQQSHTQNTAHPISNLWTGPGIGLETMEKVILILCDLACNFNPPPPPILGS